MLLRFRGFMLLGIGSQIELALGFNPTVELSSTWLVAGRQT